VPAHALLAAVALGLRPIAAVELVTAVVVLKSAVGTTLERVGLPAQLGFTLLAEVHGAPVVERCDCLDRGESGLFSILPVGSDIALMPEVSTGPFA